MKWLALLSLFILVSADSNLTSIPFVIPGADFVGYGYDIRYLATEHALRFPLVDWTYTNAKAYSYPLNRDDVYLVPDQLYVRTVARTDAESYVFSSVEEIQNTESQSHGLKADAAGEFDPLQWLPEENRTELFSQLRDKYPTGSIITPNIQYESKSFSLGSEITNAKSALSKNENYYVRNRQVNQLYQLFLDKRPLRRALENDMQKLYNQDWRSNQEAYEAFFERYGTHVVVSAMLGGAISLDSIVQRTAIQQITTSVQNFSQQQNSTHVDQKNQTVDDTLIRDSPLCNGTNEGYGYNPFKGTCELLPESWCYEPMTDILDEQFTSVSDANRPWSPTGPSTPPSRGYNYDCSFPPVPWCEWWWIFRYCWYVPVCHWVDLGPYPDPAFGVTKAVDLPVTGCPGCNSIFVDTAGLQYQRQRIGQYRDFKTQPNPQLISFFFYGGSAQGDHGIVEVVDTRNIENKNDDIPILQFAQNGNTFGLRSSPDAYSSISTGIVMPAAGVWYEIRLVMNYTDKSCDLWYRAGTQTKWLLGEKKHPFFYSDSVEGYRVGRISLWNLPSGVRDNWSGFKFCNPLEGAPYKPLTTHTAVATTTAKFKQVVSGKLDTSFENTYNKFTLYQSNNWKLKGGDSSMVDLLNFRETTDVFEAWKVTIETNPAPVQFTLKEISQFFPDVNTTFGVSQRDLVKFAVTEFLRTQTTLDPIIDTRLNDTIITS